MDSCSLFLLLSTFFGGYDLYIIAIISPWEPERAAEARRAVVASIDKRSLGQCTLGITSCPVPRNYTDYHFSILTGAETQSRYQKNAFFLCLTHRIRQVLKALLECNASKDGNFYFLSLYMSICFHVMMIYKSPLPNLGSRLGR